MSADDGVYYPGADDFSNDPIAPGDTPAPPSTGVVADFENMDSMPPALQDAIKNDLPRWQKEGLSKDEIDKRMTAAAVSSGKASKQPDDGVFYFNSNELTNEPGTAKSDLTNDNGFYQPPTGSNVVPNSPSTEPDLVDLNANALKMTKLGTQAKAIDDALAHMKTRDDYNAYLNSLQGAAGEVGMFNQPSDLTEEEFQAEKSRMLDQRSQIYQDLRAATQEQQRYGTAMENYRGDANSFSGRGALIKHYAKEGLSNVAPMAAGLAVGALAPEASPLVLPAIFGSTAGAETYGEERGAALTQQDDQQAPTLPFNKDSPAYRQAVQRARDDAASSDPEIAKAGKLALASLGINAVAGLAPGAGLASNIESRLGRALYTAGLNEATMGAMAPAQAYARSAITGEPVGDVAGQTEEALLTGLGPSAAFGGVAALHGASAEQVRANREAEIQKLYQHLKDGYGLSRDIEHQLEGDNASEVPSDENEVPQGVPQGGNGPEGGAPRGGAEGGADLQRGAGAGNGPGDAQGVDRGVSIDLNQYLKPEEIRALESAGMAENGRMNGEQFQAWRDNGAQIPAPDQGASVPFMVTNKMKAGLSDLGWSPRQIAKMTPEQANYALRLKARPKDDTSFAFDDTAFARTEPPEENAPLEGIYSALTRSVNSGKGMPRVATGDQWAQWLDGAQRRGEFKPAERDWSGVDQFLKEQPGPITREQLQDFVRNNQVNVNEAHLTEQPEADRDEYERLSEKYRSSEDLTPEEFQRMEDLERAGRRSPRFQYYTLPGPRTNEREVIFTLPRDQVRGSNYSVPGAHQYPDPDLNYNRLMHMRMSDRTGPNGEKVLHVDEIQSDMQQQGRKEGYETPETRQLKAEWNQLYDERRAIWGQLNKDRFNGDLARLTKERDAQITQRMLEIENHPSKPLDQKVPDVPLKKEWAMLGMKRALDYAARNGYDRVTWATGDQQVARYPGLEEKPSGFMHKKNPDGTYKLSFRIPRSGELTSEIAGQDFGHVPEGKLASIVGKELAGRVVRTDGQKYFDEGHYLESPGLKIGGAGMRAFYDSTPQKTGLVDLVGQHVKKYGGRVEDVPLRIDNGPDVSGYAKDHLEAGANVHSVKITDAMREAFAKEGQPLFAKGERGPANILSPGDAARVVRDAFGSVASRKLANRVKFVSRADLDHLLPGYTPGELDGVHGFTRNGQAHVVYDNVPRDLLPSIMVHEAWHANADNVLSRPQQKQLADFIRQRAKSSPEIQASLDRIPKSTPKSKMDGETIAQVLGDLQQGNTVWRRIMDAIKLGLNRVGVPLKWLDANEAILREMGRQNLGHFAEKPIQDAMGRTNKPRLRPKSTPDQIGRTFTPDEAPAAPARARAPSVSEKPQNSQRGRPAEVPPEATHEPVPLGPDDGRTFGVKNAAKAEERAGRGLEPLDAIGRRDFGSVWDTARARIQKDPLYGQRLSAEIAANPRALTPEETAALSQYGAHLNNRYEEVLRDVADARQSGNIDDQVQAQVRRQEVEDYLRTHDEAARQSGYEQGLSLALRRALSRRDYSLETQLSRFRAIEEDGQIPEKVERQIREETAKIASIKKQMEGKENTRASTRKRGPQSLEDEYSQMRARLAELTKGEEPPKSGNTFARTPDNEIIDLVRKMARNRVQAGETDPFDLVDRIQNDIAGALSRQEIKDIVTGVTRKQSAPRSELTRRMAEIKKQLRRELPNSPEARQLQRRAMELQSEIDQHPNASNPFHYDLGDYRLETELAQAQNRIEALAKKREEAQQGPVAKLASFIVKLKRFNILTSVITPLKLGAAVGARTAITPLEEMSNSVMRHMPLLNRVAARSPRFSRGLDLDAEAQALKHMGDLGQYGSMLRHGADALDALYGTKGDRSPEFLSIMGHIHGFFKEPAKLAEFYRSYTKGAKWEYRNAMLPADKGGLGMTPEQARDHMTLKSTQAVVAARAYADAKRAIFQHDTVMSKLFSMGKTYLRNKGMTGTVKALDFTLPITKVPLGILDEASSYAFGGVRGINTMLKGRKNLSPQERQQLKSWTGAKLFLKGIDSLTPQQADHVMRNFNKNTVGLALLYAGFHAGTAVFGGLPQLGDSKRYHAVDPDAAKITGAMLPKLIRDVTGIKESSSVNIPRWAFESPAMAMLQMGATVRRLMQDEHKKAGNAAVVAAGEYGAKKVPFIDQPQRYYDAFRYGRGWDEVVGGEVRNALVPQVVQQAARFTDPRGQNIYTRPRNIGEDVESGLPYFREKVPTRH